MRTHIQRRFVTAVACASVFSASPAFPSSRTETLDASAKPRNQVAAPAVRIPLVFIENQGQFQDESCFQVRLPRWTLAVLSDGWSLEGPSRLRMRFDVEGAASQVRGLDPLSLKANYFLGQSEAAAGAQPMSASTYEKVRVEGLKPGVDLELFSKAGQLEYDVHLAAHVPASEACFRLEGVQQSAINERGELIASVDGHQVRQRAPRSFQIEADGTRRPIGSRFVALGEHRFGFELVGRDPACPVVIDPVLVYNEFVGGSNADVAEDIAVDALGDMYIAGWTKSTNFPGLRSDERAQVRGRDVVVFKLSADGAELLYVAIIGGSSDEEARGLAVDSQGRVTVVGFTKSSNFPVTNGVVGPLRSGGSDAFALQLDASGRKLNWATFLGGSSDDEAYGVALAEGGSALIVGSTRSSDFPTSNFALQEQHAGGRDGFALRLDNTGRLLLYSTYLGGARDDQAHAVAMDSMGNAYVAGETDSPDFPVSEAALDPRKSSGDAFVTKLGRAGDTIVYSTFLGGEGVEAARAIALDSRDRVWVAGSTSGLGFPVTEDAMQATPGGAGDGFAVRLSISGSKLEYATYIGGSGPDEVLDLALDAFDSPWFTGSTRSDDFRYSSEAPGQSRVAGLDSFLLSLSGDGGQLNFSTYLGMGGNEEGRALAIQPGTESVVVVGYGDDIDPADRGPRSGSSQGPSDALVARFESSLCPGISQLVDLGGAAGLEMQLSRPRLGAPFKLQLQGAPPESKGLLVMSTGAPVSKDLESLAVLHLDRSRLTILERFVTNADGHWSLEGRIANRSDLCGLRMIFQAFTLERKLGPLSFGQASQGLDVTFGY